MTLTLKRIPQYPLNQRIAVPLGTAKPGEDFANTIKAVIDFERSLVHNDVDAKDPTEYLYVNEWAKDLRATPVLVWLKEKEGK